MIPSRKENLYMHDSFFFVCMCVDMGVSLNGGTPISHPKMIINPWLLGTLIFGNTHICIYDYMNVCAILELHASFKSAT